MDRAGSKVRATGLTAATDGTALAATLSWLAEGERASSVISSLASNMRRTRCASGKIVRTEMSDKENA